MSYTTNIIIGFLVAILSILVVKKIFPKKDHAFWRVGLVIAALIYVGFALIGQSFTHIPMEIGGVLLYGSLAWLSKKYTLHWLMLGWGLHIGWDVLLHTATPYVPISYAPLCIGFDIAIAGYIGWLIWERKSK